MKDLHSLVVKNGQLILGAETQEMNIMPSRQEFADVITRLLPTLVRPRRR
jgi:hypothetical protein